jgi:hypothetical protein
MRGNRASFAEKTDRKRRRFQIKKAIKMNPSDVDLARLAEAHVRT